MCIYIYIYIYIHVSICLSSMVRYPSHRHGTLKPHYSPLSSLTICLFQPLVLLAWGSGMKQLCFSINMS